MMTGLSIVLGTSLILFVGSLAYAMIQDWVGNNRTFQKLISDQATHNMPQSFQRAARRPVRVLGSFIL